MSFPNLFTPVKIGELELKNRFVLAPLTRARSVGRIANKANELHYEQRAGFGLVITEATTVSEIANGWADSPGIYTQEMCDAWKLVVKAVHDAGGLIVCQLWFIGRASHSSYMPNGDQIVSASDIPIEGESHTAHLTKEPYETPRLLTTEEISEVVESYGKATEYALEAGFDGVEVHSANGYLIDPVISNSV